MSKPYLTHAAGAPVADKVNVQSAGPRGPLLLQDIWLIEKLAHFDREVIPERRMHAKGSGATTSYFPNQHGEWTDGGTQAEPPLELTGDARHWDHRVDQDHGEQPGALFRLMNELEQSALFANTARAMSGTSLEVRRRHVDNCRKADPAYGRGVAHALGLELEDNEAAE